MKCVFLISAFLTTFVLGQGGGGQTASSPSAWTIDSVKSHYDDILKEIDHRYEQRFQAQERALAEADKRYDQRFQAQEDASKSYKLSSNEFRGTLSDQAGRFVSRAELGGYVLGLVAVMGVLAAWVRRSSANHKISRS